MARRWIALGLLVATLLPVALIAGETNIFLRGAELPRPVLNIAHAGASSLAPQNTLAAGRKALQAGADLWAIDTRLTKDGVFVLMHDESLKRTTDVEQVFPSRSPWLVKDFTLEEIKELDAGSWFVETDPFGRIRAGNVPVEDQQAYIGEPVPTLREALEFTRENDWRVDIEVKPMGYLPRERIAEQVVTLIEETGMEDRVMVSSFDHDLLREVKRLSNIPTAALVIFAPRDPVKYRADLGADAYDPSPLAFNPQVAAELRELGYGVYIWTYNEPNQLRNFAATEGVSGIFTDF
ncbi:MAG: glycerophosphodiester phosphodiesterase, partial [Candidatus Bipolaricaulia bacterium]